jgi:hypothetical protein
MVIAGLLALMALVLPLPVLTAIGAHERGLSIGLASLAGVFFPITWTAWYLRDEHPYERANGRDA